MKLFLVGVFVGGVTGWWAGRFIAAIQIARILAKFKKDMGIS